MRIDIRYYGELLDKVSAEINRGNSKHGHAPKATAMETVVILTEEIGEYAQAVMQLRDGDAERELIQIVAVALNRLTGYGPHFSHD